MTMITPSYLGETIEYSSLHACRSTLEDPTSMDTGGPVVVDGMVLVNSGYGQFGGMPGNALLTFSVDGK